MFNCKNHEYRDIYTLHSGDQLPLDPGSGSGFDCIPGVEFPPCGCGCGWLMVSVTGSYNGILCLYDNDKEIISLWNFSIRRKLIVPRRPKTTDLYDVALGFGFDPITDDYNIVAVCYNLRESDEIDTSSYIYSLKTNSWSAIPSPPSRITFCYVSPRACFFNGILHWVGCGYSTIEPTRKLPRFYIDNLSSLVFGYILLLESWRIVQVATINGCLAVVCQDDNSTFKDDYRWIGVMKEYGNIESCSAHFKVERIYGMTVFQPTINGDILAYNEGSKVYNTRTKFTKFLQFGPGCFKVSMDPYVESLELVDKERATTCGKTVFSWKKKDDHKL